MTIVPLVYNKRNGTERIKAESRNGYRTTIKINHDTCIVCLKLRVFFLSNLALFISVLRSRSWESMPDEK